MQLGVGERVQAFLQRQLDGEWPYLWLDATYLKVREGGRIVSVAAIIAVAVNTEGRGEIVGLHIGPSEAETFWATFLKDLKRRGLKGVKLVVSDAHEGLKAAIQRVIGATWQRCRVHFMRNALAHVPKGQHTMVAAAIRQAFLQPDHASARQAWRHVADQMRPRWPKLAALMDSAEADVLTYMTFPPQHRTKLHSTNPLERLNKEVKRRADVVGIFPNEDRIVASSMRSCSKPMTRGGSSTATCRSRPWPSSTPQPPSPRTSSPPPRPHDHGHPRQAPNLHLVDGRDHGQGYAGINVLMLWASAMERGFAAPIWMTYRQAQELGGHARKGEKGSPVVYAGSIQKTEEDAQIGEEIDRTIPVLKSYTVFNVEQIDGLPAHYLARAENTPVNPDERIGPAKAFFAATGADIGDGGNQAFSAPGPDRIQMPAFAAFRDAQSYYVQHSGKIGRRATREVASGCSLSPRLALSEMGTAGAASGARDRQDRGGHAPVLGRCRSSQAGARCGEECGESRGVYARSQCFFYLREDRWRRGWDSNPRYGLSPYNGLANRRLQPLGHPSTGARVCIEVNQKRQSTGAGGTPTSSATTPPVRRASSSSVVTKTQCGCPAAA